MNSPLPAFARVLSRALTLSLALALGCSNDTGPRCYPVSGKVMFAGKPLAESEVVFHPLAAADRTFPKPTAVTDAEGRFRLTTQALHDGAPVGDYQITVVFREQRLAGEEMVRDGENLLPPRYASPAESGLSFSVTSAAHNEVPPLELENR